MSARRHGQGRRGHKKRHTWPISEVDRLETIPESPLSTPKLAAVATASEASLLKKSSTTSDEIEELHRSQLFWYSHVLSESQQERNKLSKRIKQLEAVCRSQAQANEDLREEITSWQRSYDVVEFELLEASKDAEEARKYVHSVEASCANLRDALAQSQENFENVQNRRLRKRMRRWWHTYTSAPSKYWQRCESVKKNEALKVPRAEAPEPTTPRPPRSSTSPTLRSLQG